MSSEIKADKWSPASGTSATIGDSGDTYTIPSGVTLNTSSATLTLPSTVISGQTAITSLADTDKFLVSDASDSGNLKYVEKQYLPSGSHVKLLSGSASSSANHDFQSFMDTSKYNTYMVQFSNLIGLGGATLDLQFLDGTSVSGAGYWDAMQGYRSGGSAFVNNNENTSEGRLGTALLADSAARVASYLFWIYNNPNSSQFGSSVYGHNWGYRSDFGDYLFTDFTIGFDNNNNTNGFRVHSQNGNSTTFDYAIYGIAK